MPVSKRKQKTTGGEFVGKGAYGCTFYPAVECADTVVASSSEIGKVFSDEGTADDELKNVSILARIDPQQHYFLYPHRKCTVTINRAAAEDKKRKCDGISAAALNGQRVLDQLLLEHGGKDLFKFAHSEYPNKTLSRVQAVRLCYRAFEAVRLLAQSGWVHQDIKPDNIVHGPRGTRIIDFGSLMPASQFYCVVPGAVQCPITNYMIDRDHAYPYSGPENRIVHEHKSVSNTTFRNSEMSSLMKLVDFQTLRSIVNPQKFKDSIKRYVALMNKKSQSERVIILRAHRVAEKVDVYSMGAVLLQLGMLLRPAAQEPEAAEQYNHLVTSCLLAHPSDRFSASQCLDYMDTMLRPKKSMIVKTNRIVPVLRSMSPSTPRLARATLRKASAPGQSLAGRVLVAPEPLFSRKQITPFQPQQTAVAKTQIAKQMQTQVADLKTPVQRRTSVRSHPLKSNP